MPLTTVLPPTIYRSTVTNYSNTIGGTPTTDTDVASVVAQNPNGRPFLVSLQPNNNGGNSNVVVQNNGASVQGSTTVVFKRNGTPINSQEVANTIGAVNGRVIIPTTSFSFTDHSAPAGANTYAIDISISNNGGGSSHQINNFVLQAYEVRD